jgi:hypothetical protein
MKTETRHNHLIICSNNFYNKYYNNNLSIMDKL